MSTGRYLLKHLRTTDKIIWIITLFLISSFLIFESYSWGRYVLLASTALIAVLSITSNKMKYKYMLRPFHYHMLAMITFTFMSAAWGMSASDAVQKGVTLLEIFICMFVLYNHYSRTLEPVYQLLSIIKWSSYVISIYSLYFYGTKFITQMVQSGIRIENEYANINAIGMLAAMGITIQIDQILNNRRFYLSALFCVPSFYMLIATQSRKAFVMLILGVVLSAVFRSIDRQNSFKSIVRVLLIGIVFFFVIRQLLKLPIFSATLNRIDRMIASFTGEGQADRSAMLRKKMVEIGVKQFKTHPILGIGFGSSHLVLKQTLGFDTYLHNNYVEVLACGGIIGFLIYYSAYLNIIIHFLHSARIADDCFAICCTILILLLIVDYGSVSIFSKMTYFYLMTFFIEVEVLNDIRNRVYLR